MKSGNNGNQCVSVKKRLKIQYFRDFTGQKLLSYKLFGRYPSSCRDVFVENSD